jgi:predicted phage terminase large subunit-like protein
LTATITRLKRSLVTPRQRKEAMALALYERKLRLERGRQSRPHGGLMHFVRYFWTILEPNNPFIDGWPLWAMCEHLEAVSRGEITKLLINVPPGSAKSLLVNVFWPAWEWSAFGRPDLRYVSFSYSSALTERDNQRFLDLIKSTRFRDMWGHVFSLTADGKIKPTNSAKGWKFATSFLGVGTGERGNRVLIDDPHNIADGESDKIRNETVRQFREAISNRLNDMTTSALVVIMQRVHESDVSGAIIDDDLGYVHLCITMEYEPDRHCETAIGWSDPRTREGECFWPARFPPAAVAACKKLGPYAWNSQYQQRPEIRGGGLIKRDWWQPWSPADGKWPVCDFTIASLDPAFTSKEENDPSGFTVWGVFRQKNGDAGIILLHAFRKHLELHGGRNERWPGETDDDFRSRCKDTWGLCETVADACRRFRVKHLLVESKASGISVAQEMRRLHGREGYSIQLIDPKGLDKTARVIRVQPMFTEGQIFAPFSPKTGTFYSWAQMVIDETAIFPRGKHDDLVDSMSQSLWWLRGNGFAARRDELFASKQEAEKFRKPEEPLYPA